MPRRRRSFVASRRCTPGPRVEPEGANGTAGGQRVERARSPVGLHRTRRAEVFREVGPALGFVPVAAPPAMADVVAVTDFAAVPAFTAALVEGGAFDVFGNVFVRRAPVPRAASA